MDLMGAGHKKIVSSIMFSALLFGCCVPLPAQAGESLAAGQVLEKPSGGEKPDFTELEARVAQWVDDGLYPGAGLLIGRGNDILFEH